MPAIFLGTGMGARFFHTTTLERFWAALHGLLVCGVPVLVGKGFAKMRESWAMCQTSTSCVNLEALFAYPYASKRSLKQRRLSLTG